MKYWLTTMCFSTLTVSAALAQQEKAILLPPNAAAEAPKLEVPMKFRPNDLNDIDNATRQNSRLAGLKKEVTEAAARYITAVCFVIGALISRYAWIAVGRVSSRDPQALFRIQRPGPNPAAHQALS